MLKLPREVQILMKDKNKVKNYLIFFLLFLLIGGIGYILGIKEKNNSDTNLLSGNETNSENFAPTAETEINEAVVIPVKGVKTDLSFTLLKARKMKVIANQGNLIEAKEGQEFLIISIEIKNDNPTSIMLDSQNFIRLVGEDGKMYAPDFYNGQKEIPGSAVKVDDIGFLISDSQNQFKLQVGQIDSKEKSEINIVF